MQILKYESEQYAGVKDQRVLFFSGMNVVLGKNEAGKSTMLSGIYDTLFQSARLDGRKDREFIEQRFPNGGANNIDGTVGMEACGQEISVKKEWMKKNSGCRTILRFAATGEKFVDEEAERKLEALCGYSRSVYDNIIFGRQNNKEAILSWFYDFMNALSEGKTDDASMMEAKEKISGAFSAAGGISEEVFLQKLEEMLSALISHWDVFLDAPEKNKGIKNPWKKEVGEILQAYYDLQVRKEALGDAKRRLESMEALEKELEEKRETKSAYEKVLQILQLKESAVGKKELLLDHKSDMEKKLRRMEEAYAKWPGLLEERAYLKKLREESGELDKRRRKQALKQKLQDLESLEKQRADILSKMRGLERLEEDVKECRRLSDSIRAASDALGSAKLHARLDLCSGRSVQVTTADGSVTITGESYSEDVNGFVKLSVPDTGEIMITPRSLDVKTLQEKLAKDQAELISVCERYGVEDAADLEALSEQYLQDSRLLGQLEIEMSKMLAGVRKEDIVAELERLRADASFSIRDCLEEEVQSVLNKKQVKTLDECIWSADTKIRMYEDEYGTKEELFSHLSMEKEKLSDMDKSLEKLESITPMTKGEFEAQKKEAEEKLNGGSGLNQEIENLIAQINRIGAEADEMDLEALEQDVRQAEAAFARKKKLYQQYSKIKADFENLKSSRGNQYDAFYTLFNEYLAAVTGGHVRMEDGKVLKSGVNALSNKEFLSQGTKQTVLLAFRLALSKYYFQDEGGVIFFDDVLLDMDPKRREHAAGLLQEFAKKNQIIFTTCDPGIADLLGGNRIVFGE